MPTHQIRCAHDDCDEWSMQSSYQRLNKEALATRHRTVLAKDGWVDFEGRDYCPDHNPAA